MHPTLAAFALDVRALGRAIGEATVEVISNAGSGKLERRISRMPYVPADGVGPALTVIRMTRLATSVVPRKILVRAIAIGLPD